MTQQNDFQPPESGESPQMKEKVEDSPYEPPDSPVGESPGAGGTHGPTKIFTPGGVGVGTFLGGPIAATVLMAMNFGRVGWEARQRNTVIIGILATLVVFAIAFALPANGGTGLAIVWVAIAVYTAKQYQPALQEELGADFREASNWKAAGIGCVSFIAMIVVGFVGGFLFYAAVGM
jgi:hypothetical protein